MLLKRSPQLNESIRDFIKDNKVPNPLNVTLTEKQTFNGFFIDDFSSEQNFRHFRNILNTKVFGNGYRRFGNQLQMLVVREVSGGGRHHLHCVIEQPNRYGFDEFTLLISESWNKTNYGYRQIHIEKPSSQYREDGWIDYILKDRTKISLESSIDWTNSTVLHH